LDKQTRKHLKALIVEEGLDKQVAKACNQSFRNHDESLINELKETRGEQVFKIAKNINNAKFKRKKRARQKFDRIILTSNAIFLTLTFTDEVIEKTSEETRRRYVSRFLKRSSLVYVANIDYGNDGKAKEYIADNGEKRVSTAREHYHALVYAEKVDKKQWKYGDLDFRRVHTSTKDSTKVCAYLAKLSNHAFKVKDGKAPRLIYSRNKPVEFEKFLDALNPW
jgi:hypothetical protein